MSADGSQEERRWTGRPRTAFAIRTLVFVVPIALSAISTHLISRVISRPSALILVAGWWIGLTLFATAVLFVADKVARRLLPLAALFQLSLVFPDRAPSRFKSALRTQTVHQLEERVTELRESGLPDDPIVAAETLIQLVTDLSVHDRLTRGHAERVRAYSRMIGEELGLDDEELERLQWAGLLHDVGKLFVPGEILNKPGQLTDEEFEVIKQHPGWGAEMCEPLRGWLGEWVDAVGEHHERWDGGGYPNGVAGDEIALAARIVSVADVYDVITSARSYKAPSTAVEGRHELARCAGTQFDPRVVRAFLSVSLGRLRLVMGPLSWLAQLPVIGRMPLSPAVGATLSAAATAVTLIAGGLIDQEASAERATPVVEASAFADVTLPEVIAVPTSIATPIVVVPTTSIPASTTTTTSTTTTIATTVAATATLPIESGSIADVTSNRTTTSAPRVVVPVVQPIVGPSIVVTTVPTAFPTIPPATTIPITAIPVVTPPATTTVPSVPTTVAPPVAVDDVAAAREGVALLIDVGLNDSGAVTASLTTPPANGTVEHVSGTVFRYTPPPGWFGRTVFGYVLTNSGGATSSATVTITVEPAQRPPIAVDDTAVVDEDASVVIAVLANDSDPDGDPLTVVGLTALDGSATTDGTTVTYVPQPDTYGTHRLSYAIDDGTGRLATASVTITVNPTPDPPRATDDAYSTLQDITLTVGAPGVLANDSDEDGDALSVTLLTPPASGAVTLGSDGSFTYDPDPLFLGSDSFEYTVSDGTGGTDTGSVSIVVSASSIENRLYLGRSGTSATDWTFSTSVQPKANPEPDHELDGSPGFTIEKGSQKLTETNPLRYQHWNIVPSSDLVLNGPVVFELWSTVVDFGVDKDADYSLWLLDCAGDGTGCTTLASAVDVHVDEWNGGSPTWVYREITIGSVDHTIVAGRMLRLRVMFDHQNVWIALSEDRPSRLVYTQAS